MNRNSFGGEYMVRDVLNLRILDNIDKFEGKEMTIALDQLDGVEAVHITPLKHKCVVGYDTKKISEYQIENFIKDSGFDYRIIST